MSFPNNHTYKVANGISTISCIDRHAANRKTYANEAGVPYTTDGQVWGRARTSCVCSMAKFQQKTNEALEAMVANHQELVAGLKVRDVNI
jgi:hypothetical protein